MYKRLIIDNIVLMKNHKITHIWSRRYLVWFRVSYGCYFRRDDEWDDDSDNEQEQVAELQEVFKVFDIFLMI